MVHQHLLNTRFPIDDEYSITFCPTQET